MPKQKTTLELLFGNNATSHANEKLMKAELGSLYAPYENIKKVLNSNGVYMRMPFDIQIH